MKTKVKCPYCGCPVNVVIDDRAEASGLLVKCKSRHCRRTFEIKVKEGKQVK